MGENIRAFRLQKGMSQADLAKGIVTPSMISQIEADKAKPSHYVLMKLTDRLDVSLEDLAGNSSPKEQAACPYHMAKAMISKGEYAGALRALDHFSQQELSKGQSFDVESDRIVCLLALHLLEEAAHHLAALCAHRELRGDKHRQAQLHYLHGLLQMKRRRYQRAADHFDRALQGLPTASLEAQRLKRSILVELDQAQQQVGRLQTSLQAIPAPRATSEMQRELEPLANLYLFAAENYLDANQMEEAGVYAQLAVHCMEAIGDTHRKLVPDVRKAVRQVAGGNSFDAKRSLHRVANGLGRIKQAADADVAFAELAKLQSECGRLQALRVQASVARVQQPEFASSLLKPSADCFQLV